MKFMNSALEYTFQILKKTPKLALILTLPLFTILTITPIYYPLLGYPIYLLKNISNFNLAAVTTTSIATDNLCDLFSGEWIPNPDAPYYNHTTCWAIHEHQNCMKYGRPDTEFMKWKWKPDGCDLDVFDPFEFLEIVGGKSLAFVGDSISRNQMQSLICLLSRVEYPIDVSITEDVEFKRFKYTTYNFTIASLWSPFLVESDQPDPFQNLFNLHLDQPDTKWTSQIQDFDYIIISAGHWFTRPLIFSENRHVIGCQYCQLPNVTDISMFYGYKKSFETAFKSILSTNFTGVTYLRTFAPSHFENGFWDRGGNCVRSQPFKKNETRLEGGDLEFYKIQLEEFRVAEREGKKNGHRFRVMDTTQAMLLRPDGHPNGYGHLPNANVSLRNDCVHWCLPGPIDTWSEFLLEMLKMEEKKLFS